MSAASVLRFRDVSLVRGGRLLFEGLDLLLEPGGAMVVTGPNGAGKTSLIRLAAGLLRAAAGEVERACGAALADENPALDARLTLGQALGFWARLDGDRADNGMEGMGLGHLAAVPVRMLSAGQRKRATLARVVASGAALWLLDEPLNGLDADGQERLAAALSAHRAGGGALLAASHQPLALPGAAEIAL